MTGLREVTLPNDTGKLLQPVWSGPGRDSPGETRRIFEELFTSAEHSLWISSYVARYRRDVLSRLARHIDVTPGLRVVLILNVPSRRGDDRAPKVVVRQFADRFWKSWPGTKRPCVYHDPRPVRGKDPGELHAKVVVADGERVFVTSANLTPRAWDDNIELGVLLRDRDFAGRVVTHLQSLIDSELLLRLPGSCKDARGKGNYRRAAHEGQVRGRNAFIAGNDEADEDHKGRGSKEA